MRERHLETYEKMWGIGVVHHIHVYTCIHCRMKETQKPISSILYTIFLTCSTIPEPLKIAACPLCWYSSSHVLCPSSLFFLVSPCVVQGKKWATTTYLWVFFPLFLFFCEVRASLPPPTPFIWDSTNICRIQYVVLIVFRSSSTKYERLDNPKP
jgi:hypothetical protein